MFFSTTTLIILLFLVGIFKQASAQIITDGTVGPAQSLSGPDYQIPQNLGTTTGDNLFHSFERFGLTQNESASFTGANSIQNVISRVTGGETSSIDGLLRSEVGNADFFFINPAGVVFGPNAQVDVPAAFHVSTADELRFDDGNVFSGTDPEKSTLTMAEPAAFGYLSPQPASVVLNGSQLTFAPESRVSLVGGDVTIIGDGAQGAVLESEGGNIRLTATGDQAGMVPIENVKPEIMGGKVRIEASSVDASGPGGGQLGIKAGGVQISAANVSANNTGYMGDVDGGVDLDVDGPIQIDQGSRIESNAFGEGGSAGIRVSAASLTIEQSEGERFTGLFSEVEPEAAGDSGGIDVKLSKKLLIKGVGSIMSSTWGAGNAGPIQIETGDLAIDGDGRIVNYRGVDFTAGLGNLSLFDSTGNCGMVLVSAKNMLSISNMGDISSATLGKGNAGDIIITASEILLDGKETELGAGISAGAFDQFSGKGGSVNISAYKSMTIKGNAYINSFTAGNNNAGTININVVDNLEVINGSQISSYSHSEGNAGNIIIESGRLIIDGIDETDELLTGIWSEALPDSQGDAGSIDVISHGPIEILNGARISSRTFAKGNSGEVNINSSELFIKGIEESITGIWSQASLYSEGAGGNLNITVDGLLKLIDGGSLSTGTYNAGDAGNVKVHANEISIQGCQWSTTGIESDATIDSKGDAGRVEVVSAGLLELLSGGTISANTYGEGDAGDVIVHAGEFRADKREGGKLTGVMSDAMQPSKGNAGTVDVKVDNVMELIGGARISSSTYSDGSAGDVLVKAGKIWAEGELDNYSFIGSEAYVGSRGDAGHVNVAVDGIIELSGFATISSNTRARGDAGSVTVHAKGLRAKGGAIGMMTGVRSEALPASKGNAGAVDVTVDGLLELLDYAQISAETYSEGDGGLVKVGANEIKMSGQGAGISSDAFVGSTGNAGHVLVYVDGVLEILNESKISSKTTGKGNAGDVEVEANSIRIEGSGELVTGIVSYASPHSEGNGGTVEIKVSEILEILDGGEISTSTYGGGDAGRISVHARELRVKGCEGCVDVLTGIGSKSYSDSDGSAGSVFVTVNEIVELLYNAHISTGIYRTEGNAGEVRIEAEKLRLDNSDINSDAGPFSKGNAGIVTLIVDETIELFNNSNISSKTYAQGDAGSVEVVVDGSLELLSDSEISSGTFGLGQAGLVKVCAKELRIDGTGGESTAGIFSEAMPNSGGDAGSVQVVVDGPLELLSNGEISSGTYGLGRAGMVKVRAKELMIDGTGGESFTGISSEANSKSEGNAGTVDVVVAGSIEAVNGARISSSTFAKGDAGTVKIQARDIRLEGGNEFAVIGSFAGQDADGGAGSVYVSAKSSIALIEGGYISTHTFSEGDAGRIEINSSELFIDGKNKQNATGVFSSTQEGAIGYVGNIAVFCDHLEILNNGQISIAARNTLPDNQLSEVPDSLIKIEANSVHLDQNTKISAESSGNVPAAAIYINANDLKVEKESRITTIAIDADGGSITVNGKVIMLRHGLITTSVEGISGDGGDIIVAGSSVSPSNVIILDGGFIQANTAAENACGGDIFIDARAIIAESGLLEVGGAERRVFNPGSGVNVIQAAAPGGEQGDIAISAPDLDISGALVNIEAGFYNSVRMATDPCRAAAMSMHSSLVLCGQGNIPAGPGNALDISVSADRVKK